MANVLFICAVVMLPGAASAVTLRIPSINTLTTGKASSASS